MYQTKEKGPPELCEVGNGLPLIPSFCFYFLSMNPNHIAMLWCSFCEHTEAFKNDSDLNIRWFSLVKVWIECGHCNEESCSCFLPIVWGLQKASSRPGLRVCSQWNGWMLTVSVLRSPLDQVLFYHLDILISNKNVGLDAEEGSAVHSGLVPCIGAEAYMTTS